jgi:hypothetical protein
MHNPYFERSQDFRHDRPLHQSNDAAAQSRCTETPPRENERGEFVEMSGLGFVEMTDRNLVKFLK